MQYFVHKSERPTTGITHTTDYSRRHAPHHPLGNMEKMYEHQWPTEWDVVDDERDAYLAERKDDMREEWCEKQRSFREKVANAKHSFKMTQCAEVMQTENDANRQINEIRWPMPLPLYVLQAAREFKDSCKKMYLRPMADVGTITFFQKMEERVVSLFTKLAFSTESLWYMFQVLMVDCKWVHTWVNHELHPPGEMFHDVCGTSSQLLAAIQRALRKQDMEDRRSDGIAEIDYESSDDEENMECDDLESDDETYETNVEWEGVFVQWKFGKWGQVQGTHHKTA